MEAIQVFKGGCPHKGCTEVHTLELSQEMIDSLQVQVNGHGRQLDSVVIPMFCPHLSISQSPFGGCDFVKVTLTRDEIMALARQAEVR